MPLKSQISLVVYNTLGEKVKSLVNGEKEAGRPSVEYDATSLPSGVYLYKLQAVPTGSQAGDFIETKKMLLMK